MKVVKLDAIDSTNTFLKEFSKDLYQEDYTVVIAEQQTNGKGQMGNSWNSERGKNLTFSVLINNLIEKNFNSFALNITVSLAIIDVLNDISIPNLSIKWPNDILSSNKKIGGILIENIFKPNGQIVSIIGIGINVNQLNFDDLPRASSLALVKNIFFDKDVLLKSFVNSIKKYIKKCPESIDIYVQEYEKKLFKKGIVSVFKSKKSKFFNGIILGVSASGSLRLKLEDENIKSFNIKEIEMIY